jgi:dimethylhistidine N-methyltransferase
MREEPKLASSADLAQETAARARFAADVHYYLSLHPRQLPSRYFYDPLGSALFDAICRLPWYRVTRTEQRLLAAHAVDILGRAGAVSRIVELGPGNGEKLATLIETGRPDAARMEVELVDVSGAALSLAARTLAQIPRVRVRLRERSYEGGLMEIAAAPRPGGPTLLLFLGSNLGNFDPPGAEAFLRTIRGSLQAGDMLLVGADLVKPAGDLLLAYDDPLGVTAAFNRNILLRINGELGGDFAIDAFAHEAVWNADESRVEMHLVSRVRQRVAVEAAALDITLEPGERIWTESSYKFTPGDIAARLRQARFEPVSEWIDAEDRFALTLSRAV